MDIKFVISDPKNIKGHIFPKIKFSKKIRTYMTVVPFGTTNSIFANNLQIANQIIAINAIDYILDIG